MWNILGYITKKPDSEILENQSIEVQSTKINYQNIEKMMESFSKNSDTFDKVFTFPNQSVLGSFSDLIGTMHGLINVIESLEEELNENEQKLADYDLMKKKVQRHDELIRQFQERQQQQIKQTYEMKAKLESSYNEQIYNLKQKIQSLQQENKKLHIEITTLEQDNLETTISLQLLQQKYKLLEKQSKEMSQKLNEVLSLEKNDPILSPNQSTNIFSLPFILKYEKNRRNIYSYLDPKSLTNLRLVNKQINYFVQKGFKKQFIPVWYNNLQNHYNTKLQLINEAEKMYDRFPAENIKCNALKYLFFKMKPGAYIMPFVTGEQRLENYKKVEVKEEGAKNSNRWSGIFKWKEEPSKKNKIESKQQEHNTVKASLDQLSNEQQFKQTQKQIQIFFDRLFHIEMPDDLIAFRDLMNKQLLQIKTYIRTHAQNNKPQQLLFLSKFLFLETNELNNLLQVCFALLINEHTELVSIKKRCSDLQENDKVLRDLIQNIANERSQIEKRTWQLQMQTINSKNRMQKSQMHLSQIQKTNKELNHKMEKLEEKEKKLRKQYQNERREREIYEEKYSGIVQILGEFNYHPSKIYMDD